MKNKGEKNLHRHGLIVCGQEQSYTHFQYGVLNREGQQLTWVIVSPIALGGRTREILQTSGIGKNLTSELGWSHQRARFSCANKI